ncbi:NAD(P)/FAD-dependent oxidoreductase [Eilatimonas milleporae]|uniref:Glycine/D-amino acid oxidase-like deaminating enzyme n=1 Tax=Eilatimonas milleporae TaxID=911205 RepID=A0A3M0CRI2_9PROT|nr:FAD-dependent oxidoreductase [Eilatimonas milleporae]RMB12092.1 glycine/D-amino acid oxidase-like deaminating enzyme [Eilatimonas milleporae]
MPDVIIIGGGLSGCATAYFLAADGVNVTLLEQGDLNTLASGSNAGSLHAQIPADVFNEYGEDWCRAFAPTLRLYARSIDLWHDCARTFRADGGTDMEVATTGGLLVAADAADMRWMERKADIERAAGIPIDLLDRTALRDMAPYLSHTLEGGAFCPLEGKANPLIAAPAFARQAEKLGAKIRRRTAVLSLEQNAGGYVLETTHGRMTACHVVNAAGDRCRDVAAMLDVPLDIFSMPIQVSVSEPVAPLIRHLLYYSRKALTMKQSAAGTILIGGGWPARLDAMGRPVADPASLARNLAAALEVVPGLAPVNIVRTWAAHVNGTRDWRPIIGEVPGLHGFHICYVPWMGFTGGPAAARIIASRIQGREPPLDCDTNIFAP